MNSYFTNPSLPCHLGGGQEVLPNVAALNSSYDPVRHFGGYGAAVAQNRIYSSPFYSAQENAVVFGSAGRSPYEYGSNAFYQDKEALSSCRQSSVGGHGTPGSIAQDFPGEQSRSAAQEQKSGIQIYPWMQRMNSHSGKFFTSSVGGHGTPGSIAQDFPGEQSRSAAQEQKSGIQIYPWMQRMNSHSGGGGGGGAAAADSLAKEEKRDETEDEKKE
ncbi:homeobox protein Hox-C6 [Onychostruthus taczanowskii]|uniref:homeobox protein Hox-C6 n=1 Tax=Onychostruthus taczanowskii TaxID=356909 RepID=UPI001B80A0F0|nr:homeobox protein Hox-C6 [Onychostruthus taczanowskii]